MIAEVVVTVGMTLVVVTLLALDRALAWPERGRLTSAPLRDGGELGYLHPLDWPVRIVGGLPVAVGPLGAAELWCARTGSWSWLDPWSCRAQEARERLRLEETQVDR